MFISKQEQGRFKWYHYLFTFFLTMVAMQIIGLIPMVITIASNLEGESFSPEQFEHALNSISGDNILLFTGISFVAAMIAFKFGIRLIHKTPFRSIITARPKINFSKISLGLLLIILLRIPLLVIEVHLYGDLFQWNFQLGNFTFLASICILLIPIQAAFEEIFFRGYLLRGFYKATQKIYLSIGVSSVLFTLVHFANVEAISFGWSMFLFYLITAVFLALVTHFDEGTELSIGIHAGINIFTLMTITGEWSSYHTSSLFFSPSKDAFKFDIFILALVIYPLLFLILAKKYNWRIQKRING